MLLQGGYAHDYVEIMLAMLLKYVIFLPKSPIMPKNCEPSGCYPRLQVLQGHVVRNFFTEKNQDLTAQGQYQVPGNILRPKSVSF